MQKFHCHCECSKQMKNKLPLTLMAYFAFCLNSYMLKKQVSIKLDYYGILSQLIKNKRLLKVVINNRS